MVQVNIDISNRFPETTGSETLKTGVIHTNYLLDFHDLIEKFYHNDLSFEENFRINIIASRKINFDVRNLYGPFVLVSYEASHFSSLATFIDSRNVKKIEASIALQAGYKNDLHDRYRGFGNYFYKVTQTTISNACCDNNNYWRNNSEYLSRRSRGHQESLRKL